MKVCLLLSLGLLSTNMLSAQNLGTTRIKADNTAVKRIPDNQKYQYEHFKSGRVSYSTGVSATAAFNYNFLLDEMHFINPEGDTLSLANEYLIKQVVVAPDTFYYQLKIGYLQLIASYMPVKLVVKQTIRIMRNEKQSGYDQSSAVSAIKQFSFYVDQNGQVRKLQPKGNVLLVKGSNYYLIDQNGKVRPVSKAAVLTIFQKFKEQVNAYLKANKINFKQEPDIKKLLEYCQGLTTL